MNDTLATITEISERVARETRERDLWIRTARDEGSTFRRIAEAAGLSHTAIKKIVDRAP